jgi:hypothetical protein
MVHHVLQRPEEQVLNALHEPGYNWHHSAVMPDRLPPDQEKQLSDIPIRSQSTVTIMDYRPQEVKIQVETPAAGLLVLSDGFYPGWEATVDKKPTPIYRVDHALRAVFLPAGSHLVEFHFEPKILDRAMMLALFGLAVAALILGKDRTAARRQKGESSLPS